MGKPFVLISLLLLTLASAGGGYWWWLTIGSVPEAVRLCESRILQKIRSPSSYHRVIFHYRQEIEEYNRENYIVKQMQINEFNEINTIGILPYDAASDRKSIEGNLGLSEKLFKEMGLTKVTVTVDFDASNAYGSPVRTTALCIWLKAGGGDTLRWYAFEAGTAALFMGPQ